VKREAAVNRRQVLARIGLGGAALGLAGCDRLSNATQSRSILDAAENLTRGAQRALLAPRAKKLEGAIVGRALYDGRLDPAEALALLRSASQGAPIP